MWAAVIILGIFVAVVGVFTYLIYDKTKKQEDGRWSHGVCPWCGSRKKENV